MDGLPVVPGASGAWWSERGMKGWCGIVASMKRPGFFPRPVDLQHLLLGVNDRLVCTNTPVGSKWNELTITRSSQ